MTTCNLSKRAVARGCSPGEVGKSHGTGTRSGVLHGADADRREIRDGNFLGFRIWPTHKLLRKRSVLGAKRKIALYLKHGEHDRLARFIPSWLGHARLADTHHLLSWLETRYAITC